MVRVKLSPGSSTDSEYTDSVPVVTWKMLSAEIFGGKFSVLEKSKL